ncbi:TIGR03086 family metal-binding protein [Allokutzneria sp. NRRL B-24872]|uniref:TIGR03086 family metal-binding protein n=1 Tax=Allokutzneria sp. NRRL B-24872 TaxID=1137961 RepID=UPI000A389DAE|nr:TIGR03086 family metal-binding protein [Allokutzneria sp. NRRL B-24872]
MSDAIARYQLAMAGFDAVAGAVPEDRWSAASPCRGWTARDVVGHVLSSQDMLFAWIAGKRPTMPDEDPAARIGDDPRGAWRATYAEVGAALAEPGLAQRPVSTYPGGPSTVDEILDSGLVEPLVHAWDLARAADVEFTLDDALATECLRAMKEHERRVRLSGMFGSENPVADDATPGERLLAFLGRTPN